MGGLIIVNVAVFRCLRSITPDQTWVVKDNICSGHQPSKLLAVLTQVEVGRFRGLVEYLKHRVILIVGYATDLRIFDAVRLEPAARHSQGMVIRPSTGISRANGDGRYALGWGQAPAS
jgi:hypothetical protein